MSVRMPDDRLLRDWYWRWYKVNDDQNDVHRDGLTRFWCGAQRQGTVTMTKDRDNWRRSTAKTTILVHQGNEGEWVTSAVVQQSNGTAEQVNYSLLTDSTCKSTVVTSTKKTVSKLFTCYCSNWEMYWCLNIAHIDSNERNASTVAGLSK